MRNELRFCKHFMLQVSNAGLGKFSQNDSRTNSKFVTSWVDAKEMMDNPQFHFKRLEPLAKNLAELVYSTREEMTGYHKNVQVSFFYFCICLNQ